MLKAYEKLAHLKTGSVRQIPDDVHREAIKQLYSVDINPFAIQLTAVNVTMKNVKASATVYNIIYAVELAKIEGEILTQLYGRVGGG